jgi:hypothetical protein
MLCHAVACCVTLVALRQTLCLGGCVCLVRQDSQARNHACMSAGVSCVRCAVWSVLVLCAGETGERSSEPVRHS